MSQDVNGDDDDVVVAVASLFVPEQDDADEEEKKDNRHDGRSLDDHWQRRLRRGDDTGDKNNCLFRDLFASAAAVSVNDDDDNDNDDRIIARKLRSVIKYYVPISYSCGEKV
jgi:hypothetical protein